MKRPLPQSHHSAGSDDTPDLGCGDARCAEACTLNRLGIGRCGTVVKVGGDRELRRRLMEMGICTGTRVEVVRRSPFGDPIELKLRGYCLSLRGEQAQCVSVEVAAEHRE